MKFDTVIGNPPYNRGIDIDFVKLGYALSKRYVCVITPAKWQTADAEQIIASEMSYGQFRAEIVPYISHVVFYPDCKDIFDIYQCDGITYYLIDKYKDKQADCFVINNSANRPEIDKFKIEKRSILNRETLWNCGYKLVEALSRYPRLYIGDRGGQYRVMTNKQISGYDWFIKTGPRYCLAVSTIIDTEKNEEYSGLKEISFSSDSRAECESFISYINTRLVRFLLALNISSEGGMVTNDNFRFVPSPVYIDSNNSIVTGKFDHIYTDEELYRAFNISQEQIGIIEAIIKERKQ